MRGYVSVYEEYLFLEYKKHSFLFGRLISCSNSIIKGLSGLRLTFFKLPETTVQSAFICVCNRSIFFRDEILCGLYINPGASIFSSDLPILLVWTDMEAESVSTWFFYLFWQCMLMDCLFYLYCWICIRPPTSITTVGGQKVKTNTIALKWKEQPNTVRQTILTRQISLFFQVYCFRECCSLVGEIQSPNCYFEN